MRRLYFIKVIKEGKDEHTYDERANNARRLGIGRFDYSAVGGDLIT
jgi:hypothetical protein